MKKDLSEDIFSSNQEWNDEIIKSHMNKDQVETLAINIRSIIYRCNYDQNISPRLSTQL